MVIKSYPPTQFKRGRGSICVTRSCKVVISDTNLTTSLILRALRGIDASTVDEFQAASGLSSRSVAVHVLQELTKEGIGNFDKSTGVVFGAADRLRCAVAAIHCGCDIEDVSALLTWQDFEALASETLRAHGYNISRNLRLKKPRMEIDVVGVSSTLALVVDCKHWKRYSRSAIAKYCELQATRSKRLLSSLRVERAVPLIVTLHAPGCRFIDGIPIVPVNQLASFVAEVEGNLASMRVISD